jgi:hypothetical protein
MKLEETMPAFVFARRRDIELEIGLTLAGNLVVDLPKKPKLKRRHQRMIAAILQRLSSAAKGGEMPNDAVVYGWHGNHRPDNADAVIANNELMENWAETRLKIAVRIDPRNDGMIRLDSEMLYQMGLAGAAS